MPLSQLLMALVIPAVPWLAAALFQSSVITWHSPFLSLSKFPSYRTSHIGLGSTLMLSS